MRATILHTAEASLARILGLSPEEARVLIVELVRDAHPTSTPSKWRASRRWYRMHLVVELVGDDVRVLEVLPPYDGWRAPRRPAPPAPAPSTTAPRTAVVCTAAPSSPPPAPPLPDVDAGVLLLVHRELEREPHAAASWIAHRLHAPIGEVRAAIAVLTARSAPVASRRPRTDVVAAIAGAQIVRKRSGAR